MSDETSPNSSLQNVNDTDLISLGVPPNSKSPGRPGKRGIMLSMRCVQSCTMVTIIAGPHKGKTCRINPRYSKSMKPKYPPCR